MSGRAKPRPPSDVVRLWWMLIVVRPLTNRTCTAVTTRKPNNGVENVCLTHNIVRTRSSVGRVARRYIIRRTDHLCRRVVRVHVIWKVRRQYTPVQAYGSRTYVSFFFFSDATSVLSIIVDETQTAGNEKINAPRCSTRFNEYFHACTHRVSWSGVIDTRAHIHVYVWNAQGRAWVSWTNRVKRTAPRGARLTRLMVTIYP